jgi:O-antigen ligase
MALACSRDYFRSAIGYYGCLGVASLGLLATQSRGSLVAVLASAVVLSLALRKWGIAAAAVIIAGAAWPTLQVLANASPAVASFINGGGGTHYGKYYDYRNLLLERGLQVAADHPLTGMRMTQVLDALADITQGEGIVDLVNVYLVILLISGIVGLLPFLTLVVTTGLRGILGFKRVQDRALLRARGFSLAAFTMVLLQLSFVSFIDRVPMMFVLTLCGIRLMAQQRLSLQPGAGGLPELAAPPLAGEQWVHVEGDVAGRERPWIPRLPMISA